MARRRSFKLGPAVVVVDAVGAGADSLMQGLLERPGPPAWRPAIVHPEQWRAPPAWHRRDASHAPLADPCQREVTMMVTRRFCWRPASLRLSSIGRLKPKPWCRTWAGSKPRSTKAWATTWARRSDRRWL